MWTRRLLRRRAHALLIIVAALTLPAGIAGAQSAAGSAPPPRGDGAPERRAVVALRRDARITVDGRLDEPDWSRALPVGDFVQRQPREGAPSTQRTEVRVLYDDHAIYVGAWLWDTHPDSILSLLARRDESTPSDEFFAQFDSFRDRRTAFVFTITPGGVKSDLLIHDGNQIDQSWDAVWDGATTRDSSGWYVEYRIPYSQLRFALPADGAVTWNANFLRWIARNREDSQWSLIPQTASAWVPYYGELRGLRLESAPRRLEVHPYSVGRITRSSGASAVPDDASASVGADIRLGLTPNLTVTATVNPDFGQVEADPSEVNLTTVETFLPERRPFFLEGANLFRLPTSEWYDQGELFYSRRIGRAPQGELPADASAVDAPVASTILGAAKLTGKTASGWSLALLDAVTGEERARLTSADGRRRRVTVEPLANHAVARASRDFRAGESAIGVMATATHRRIDGDSSLDHLRSSALVAAVDARHRFSRSRYELTGWVAGSLVRGSRAAIAATQRSPVHYLQRPDADHLDFDSTRTSLGGHAVGLRAAKVAGNWKPQLSLRAFSPGYEVNDLGYHPRADLITQYTNIGYDQPREGRWFRSWWAYANHWLHWDFAGTRLLEQVQLDAQVELRSWWRIRATLNPDLRGLSFDALRGGPALTAPARTMLRLEVASDSRRPLSLDLRTRLWREPDGDSRSATMTPAVTWRPSTRASLRLEPTATWLTNAWQYVATADDDPDGDGAPLYLLGRLRQRTAALTARFSYVFTPDLTLQLHAQPFLSAGTYRSFHEVVDPRAPRFAERFRSHPTSAIARDGARLTIDRDGDGAADLSFRRPDFNRRELNANAVLRWEYRPGSTLFVVWSQGRRTESDDGAFDLGRDARRLFDDPAENVLLVKASYWMGR